VLTQASQFTNADFTDVLLNNGIKISMNGRGALAGQS
jgi:transposase InsO family protein